MRFVCVVFFVEQKTAYELRISDWSSDVCSSDLKSVWNDYAEANTYKSEEAQAKRRFVADFAAATKPGLLIDLGCNTGAYSEAALEGGARRVIGFDFDQGALDQAFARAEQNKLEFLPLHLDAANPSPDQDRKSAVAGKGVYVRVDHGGSPTIKKK